MRRCRPRARTCSGCKELSGFEKIVAPFDGVVTARNTDIGQLICRRREHRSGVVPGC